MSTMKESTLRRTLLRGIVSLLAWPPLAGVTVTAQALRRGEPTGKRAVSNVTNHIGHRVSDLERARSFYVNALGFEFWRELKVGDAGASRLTQLPPPLGTHNYYLRMGPFVIELMHFPLAPADRSHRRTFKEFGISHISVSVENIPATCKLVEQYGGEVLRDTDLGQAIMVRDPDGQLVELLPMSYAESVAKQG